MYMYLMNKDTPVMYLKDGLHKVLNFDLLPHSIRKRDVNSEDFTYNWIQYRATPVARTNAKQILNAFRLPQNNAYNICLACRALSIQDTFWLKADDENITWKEVNLFENEFDQSIPSLALFGEYNAKHMPFYQRNNKIHTPELTGQGAAAKCFIHEKDGIYLYKIGKKELLADEILNIFGIDHVAYSEIDERNLINIADEKHIEKVKSEGESIVKCKIITSPDIGIITYEDFAVYCDYHDKDGLNEIIRNNKDSYYTMQIADYIISNEDRHEGNWGLYLDNRTGKELKMHPIFDHDHSFSTKDIIMSQTSVETMSLEEAALDSIKKIGFKLPDEKKIMISKVPDMIKENIISKIKLLEKGNNININFKRKTKGI